MATIGRRQDRRDWHDRFQQAALDPAVWPSVLQELADATRSARGQLIGIGGPKAIAFNWVTDFPKRALAEFVALGGGSPTVNFRIAADLDPEAGAIVHEAHYRRARASLTTDTYVDYCEQYDLPFGCQATLTTTPDAMIGLAVLRTRGDGCTTEIDRGEFARAARAAAVAVRLQRAIEQQGVALLTGTLEAMTIDCLLIDAQGRVGTMTPGAERRIALGRVLTVRDGRIGSVMPDVARTLDLALRATLSGRSHARVSLGDGCRLDLFALARREWAIDFAPRVMAVIRDVTGQLSADAGILAVSHGLSPAETQIGMMLARGHDRARIATARGVSPETLKSQIKSLYQKTGCTREAQLVALFAGVAD